MEANKLKEILEKHLHWIKEDCEGWEDMRANLYGADLRGANLCEANLCGANLRGANLYGANLCGANLRGANLYGANLYGANLCEANLRGANLYGANLCEANLRGANLYGANLYGADLRGANLYGANLYGADLYGANLYGANLYGANLYGADVDIKLINKNFPICCPEYGAFIAWKKANGMIVKLQIPEDAKRSSAFGRKCKASKAVCLEIQDIYGKDSGMTEICSNHDKSFIYRVGETVEIADFDEDRTHECAPGIHFFITRQEAVDY